MILEITCLIPVYMYIWNWAWDLQIAFRQDVHLKGKMMPGELSQIWNGVRKVIMARCLNTSSLIYLWGGFEYVCNELFGVPSRWNCDVELILKACSLGTKIQKNSGVKRKFWRDFWAGNLPMSSWVHVARVVVRAGSPYFFWAQTGANIILAGKRGPDIRRPLPDSEEQLVAHWGRS